MLKIIPLELETHFAEGTVNAFLVKGETVTLVDTGNPGRNSYQQLKEKLLQHDIRVTDIDHIVLTHIHIDHAGAIPFLQEEADLPIYVHEQAKGAIFAGIEDFHNQMAFFNHFLKSCGADPLVHIVKRKFREQNWKKLNFVKEGDVIPIGGQPFQTLHVPGHSQCDMLLWNEDTGDSFAGDHLIKSFSVNAFIEPPESGESERPRPLLQYRDSLFKVSKLPLGIIYPGHGEVFSDHVALIQRRLQEQEKRCEQILHILRKDEKSIFEICQVMYPRLKEHTVFLGLSQIQGHIDLLEQREQVSFRQKGDLFVYHAV